jgi:predicted phage tail protein
VGQDADQYAINLGQYSPGVNALSKANTTNGDIGGYNVAYIIELATDNGAYVKVVDSAFSGKTTSVYQRSHRIVLPKASTGWTVRVTRTTPNANSSTVSDTTMIHTYTELIDARLRYPMSALVGIQIDASQFQSIPTRSYELYGRIISVPSNYDPVARTYAGVWDGTFKPAYTNNPAWIFYDLLINNRYGLGNLIPASYVDKWGLYAIAQYCDQMVPNGLGGTEPRFTCNVYLQTAAEAYKVLQDLATVFRGISYWAGGTIVAAADMPQDPTYIFTAANVINGKFHGVGSSKKTRYTVAIVSWNDPASGYKQKAEYVQDDDGLLRYGVQQINITAFGCTSQGQAQRVGQWVLLTSRLETDALSFEVALDALVVAPGQIVRIANPNKMGVRNGGRIRSAAGRVVTLDKAPALAVGDKLSIILPAGVSETRSIAAISGNDVTVNADWSALPKPQAVWSVDNANLVAPTYRILSITEKAGLTYEISAIQHVAGKFDYIDNGTIIQQKPSTALTAAPEALTNIVFSSSPYWVDDTVAAMNGVLSWSGKAPNYLIAWRKDDDIWHSDNVQTASYDIKGMQAGTYHFTITAVASTGLKSQAATFTATVVPQLPPLATITGLQLEQVFAGKSIKAKWNAVVGATSYVVSVVAGGGRSVQSASVTYCGMSTPLLI